MTSKIAAVQQSNSPTNKMGNNFVGHQPAGVDASVYKIAAQECSSPIFCDRLTGLSDRLAFHDRLAQALSESQRNKLYGALLVLDLNHFKALSESLPANLDMLVVEAAKRIKFCVREEDTVARFERDEFAVLVKNISTSEDAANSSSADSGHTKWQNKIS